jgi:hypothetical protein
MGEMRNEHRILVKKPEGKRPLGISTPILKDNIKLDLKKLGVRRCTMD